MDDGCAIAVLYDPDLQSEPLQLAALELVVLLAGSLLESVVIAWMLIGRAGGRASA